MRVRFGLVRIGIFLILGVRREVVGVVGKERFLFFVWKRSIVF